MIGKIAPCLYVVPAVLLAAAIASHLSGNEPRAEYLANWCFAVAGTLMVAEGCVRAVRSVLRAARESRRQDTTSSRIP